MALSEYYYQISTALEGLDLNKERIILGGEVHYKVKELDKFRSNIFLLKDVPFLMPEMGQIADHPLVYSRMSEDIISKTEYSSLFTTIRHLKLKLQLLKDIIESSVVFSPASSILTIEIPALSSFDDLSKIAIDLKKSIEIPLHDSGLGSEVEIVGADKGSIIFYVGVGMLAAVKLVGAICWSAAVIRKKRAEAKIFEEHARTLGLKNESLENIIVTQKEQLKHILQSEAEQIAHERYTTSDPEVVERLKLSINTVSALIDKGVTILPQSRDNEVRATFPAYTQLDLIESTIKQLKNSQDTIS